MAVYPTNPPGNTLQSIQQKVRRLTRTPSEAMLSTDELNNYINTFVMYDFPENLRMFNLKTTFTFVCNPFQADYPTNIAGYGGAAGATTNPLYNFQNKYLTINPPVYIAGYQSLYSQSREQFFGIYPKIESISNIGAAGDGVTITFSGIINYNQAILLPGSTQNTTLLQKEVLFSSVDLNGNGTSLIDSPILDSITGNPTIWGNLYDPINPPATGTLTSPQLLAAPYATQAAFPTNNYINYITGAYTATFTHAPAASATINSQTVPTITSIPQAVLYYDNKITLRPVPNQPYRVQFEAYERPVQLLQTNSSPQLEEWWQYIAYGCAKKIFEDRMDMDSVQMILPEYDKQERLCLRRTIVQKTTERVATIYTEQSNGIGWGGQGGFGGGSF